MNIFAQFAHFCVSGVPRGGDGPGMWWAKQSHPRNSLLGSPQCCLPPVKSQAGPEMAETVTFFLQNWSLWLPLAGFWSCLSFSGGCSSSFADICLTCRPPWSGSLNFHDDGGDDENYHEENNNGTTMKMLNYEQHKCSGHGAGSCLANNNDNNDDNDGNDNDKW